MYKIVALWSAPKQAEVDAFERYYRDVHVPKASVVPELRRIALTRVDGGLEGAAPPFYRVAEMFFDDPQALHRSSESTEWRAMREDAGAMIERFGVILTVGLGWTEERRGGS